MKELLVALATAASGPGLLAAQQRVNPTDPQPTCQMCPGSYIPASEIQEYIARAVAEGPRDQQIRDHDVGKAHVGIGVVHRQKLDAPSPNSVAEHDLVSEVYYVISGSATLVLGPDIMERRRRPPSMQTVIEFNGPSNGGAEIRGGTTYEVSAGDVVIIPAGTGHWLTKIEDHFDYLVVRLDPDKVTPLKSAEQSRQYLAEPARQP